MEMSQLHVTLNSKLLISEIFELHYVTTVCVCGGVLNGCRYVNTSGEKQSWTFNH